jgi:hypothetical protein
MVRVQWIFISLLLIAAVLATTVSIISIRNEYNDAVTGGSNHTYNPNATSAICLRVSKEKASRARDSMIAAITINTLVIGFVAVLGLKVASCVSAWTCKQAYIPEEAQKVCNVVLLLLYITLIVVAATILLHIDASCSKLAWSIATLLLVIPITCVPICCLARSTNSQFNPETKEAFVELN